MTQITTDTFCGECGAPIYNEDSANRMPCPNCSSTKRTYHLTASVTVSVSVSADARKISYPQSFLDTAREWIKGDVEALHSMAVIICHVARELATDRALSSAFQKLGNAALKQVIRKRIKSNRMGTPETRKLYTSLTGDKIEDQGFWQDYQESIKRRDNVAHNGILVSKKEAEQTHATTSELVRHLGQ